MSRSILLGVGSSLPKKVMTNDEISEMVDTSHYWIFERTGIKQRYIANQDETNSYLATEAAQEAIKDSNILVDDIELIIVATTTPEKTFPSCAALVQSRLRCNNAFVFDIQAVCAGFIYALSIADNFIKTGKVKKCLVIGSEIMSKIIDWTDRSTCVLFGDGAAAVVLGAEEDKYTDRGIISTNLHSDGSLHNILYTNGGVSTTGTSGFICMEGPIVFKNAIEKLSDVINEILVQNNLNIDDIDWFIPHQANIRIIDKVAEKLNINKRKIVVTIDKHANTSAASIPLALNYAKTTNKLKIGDLAILFAIGGGLTWGATLLRL